ncbi:diguanylate cyclase [Chitinimonas lacunae]|uniref:diguanylate cyclase n=1 Tax=Chitinimonas lacunae TaxID=1963018 RepID=A0ABV8MKQ7_9NEIS
MSILQNILPSFSDIRTLRPRLLVVDDQSTNIQLLYQVFAADHEVFMATSGEQALAFCQTTPPDLILLDLVMPGMDGFEVCRRLKEDRSTSDIPVIFVTAHDDPAEETRGLDLGAVDFISKPVNPAVVRARVRTQLTLKFQSDLLRRMVFIDGLTGVANRRHFDERLDSEWRRCARSQSPLALIMADVDFFKRYNDCYGHQAGDECLQKVAAVLKDSLNRSADLVARYGGEEFACILPDTDQPGALALAWTMEKAVRALALPHQCSDVAKVVTISLGVSAMVPQPSSAEAALLIQQADAQLYRAKQSGRAQVCGAADGVVPPDGATG